MSLFDDDVIPDAKRMEPNIMVVKFGRLVGKQCKTCGHLINKPANGTNYYKCLYRGTTNGPGTDHRLSWNACKRYLEKGGVS